MLSKVQAAATAAQESGQPTEIPEYTTETTKVDAEPDGTLELTTDQTPVRTKEDDGTWVPINTDLAQKVTSAGPVLEPEATVGDVTFSTGGAAPLVTLHADANPDTGAEASTVEVHWDGTLPAPTIAGATATYHAVRPGVDLVITAQPAGYSKTLVITDAAAAQGLIDDPVDLHMTGTGVTFTTSTDGHTTALDTAGNPVFTGAPAVLWDSHGADPTTDPGTTPGDPGSTAPTATDPGDGKILTADSNLDASGTSLEARIAPPASVVSDPSLVWPLYLDPRLERDDPSHYLTVHSRGWDYYDDSSEPMRVGYCDWAECNQDIQGTARSYLSYNIDPLVSLDDAVPKIYDAALRVTQTLNATSGAQPVVLHRATAFTSATSWPGPLGSAIQTISSAAGYGSNPAAVLTFNSSGVIDYIQDLANAKDGSAQFGLAPEDQNDKNQWKKFQNSPSLSIRFSYAPTVPTGLRIPGATQCPGKDRYVDITSSTALEAMSQSRLGAAVNIIHSFQIFKRPVTDTNVTARYNTNGVSVAEGDYASWQPASTNSSNQALLTDGDYTFRDRARTDDPDTDGNDPTSDWSAWYDFTIDKTAPAKPTISSDDYPASYWGAAANAKASFDLSTSSDAAAFSYAIDTGTTPAPGNTDCTYPQAAAGAKSGYLAASGGDATLTITPGMLASGTHTLTVKAFDDAHNLSGVTTYTFMVAPTIAGNVDAAGNNGTNRIEFGETNLSLATPTDVANDPDHYHRDFDYKWVEPNALATGGYFQKLLFNGSDRPNKTTYKLTVPVDGYYALGATVLRANHFGKITFSLDDPSDTSGLSKIDFLDPTNRANPLTVDTYSATADRHFVPLGNYLPDAQGVLLKHGTTYTLTVAVAGKNAASVNYAHAAGSYTGVTPDGTTGPIPAYNDNGYSVGLDSLYLAPLKLAPFASLGAAFDNTAAGTTAATEFDGMTTANTSLSSTALTAAGITPGSNYQAALPDGGNVTFAIPAKNAAGHDNVISQGQTINVPSNNGASAVYLLAAATCGPVIGNHDPDYPNYPVTGRYLDIHYQVEGDPTTHTTDAVHTVQDWLAAAKSTNDVFPATTMPTYLSGSTTTTGNASLYVMKFPISDYDSATPITSITLPRVGTTYTNTGCGTTNSGAQQLHIFAMTLE